MHAKTEEKEKTKCVSEWSSEWDDDDSAEWDDGEADGDGEREDYERGLQSQILASILANDNNDLDADFMHQLTMGN